jgi:hypothetical protein
MQGGLVQDSDQVSRPIHIHIVQYVCSRQEIGAALQTLRENPQELEKYWLKLDQFAKSFFKTVYPAQTPRHVQYTVLQIHETYTSTRLLS